MKQIYKIRSFIFVAFATISLVSCVEKKTEDLVETYKLWAGELPPNDDEAIHGKYWQSSLWLKEHRMYMELKASSLWGTEFIKQHNLTETTQNTYLPSDAPGWFKPGRNFRAFARSQPGPESVVYEDTLIGRMFIHESQLYREIAFKNFAVKQA